MPLLADTSVRVAERVARATRLGPRPLLDAYLGLMRARAVMAGTSLGIFEGLDEGPATEHEIAERLSLEPAGTAALLEALYALRYLDRRHGRYVNARVTKRHLVRRSPRPLAALTGGLCYDDWQLYGDLEASLTDSPPADFHARSPDDPMWARYTAAMDELARMSAGPVARLIPVERPRRLLDLGGGSGRHALAMCDRHPGLRALILELEGAATRRPYVADRRVKWIVGDVLETDLGSGHDVVTAHSVLHGFPPGRCVELLARARTALRPGGVFAALEIEGAPRGARGSEASALAGLLFWIAMRTRCYAAREIAAWLREAGYEAVAARRSPLLPGCVLLVGRRPAT